MVHLVSVGILPANTSSREVLPDSCTGQGVGKRQPGALELQSSRAGFIAIENWSDDRQETYTEG